MNVVTKGTIYYYNEFVLFFGCSLLITTIKKTRLDLEIQSKMNCWLTQRLIETSPFISKVCFTETLHSKVLHDERVPECHECKQ